MLFVQGKKYVIGGSWGQSVDYFGVNAPTFGKSTERKEVEIDDFFLAETETTREQFGRILPGYSFGIEEGRLPVDQVTIDQIKEFCLLLSTKSGKKIRLPTAYEWEFACRCGLETEFDFDPQKNRLFDYGNISLTPFEKRDKLLQVKSKMPNSWGFFDMIGNVEEATFLHSTPIPTWENWASSSYVVFKGGNCQKNQISSTDWWGSPLKEPLKYAGFRIAISAR